MNLAKGVHLGIGLRTRIILFLSLAITSIAGAQAIPAATQPLDISAFGAATGNWTGLDGGRNLGVTAGLDIGWKPFYGFFPAIEGRGTYPLDSGHVDSQKNALVGIRASRFYGRFHPYGDFLVGRGKIIYQNGGFPNANGSLLYIDSVSTVYSYGGGVDLTLSDNFSLKLDAQIQHYDVPVNSTGSIYSKPISAGIVYHFNFNHHIRYNPDGQVKGYKATPPPRSGPQPQ
jgi:opacity protein-like surface antigen